jgi:hypothetical protein
LQIVSHDPPSSQAVVHDVEPDPHRIFACVAPCAVRLQGPLMSQSTLQVGPPEQVVVHASASSSLQSNSPHVQPHPLHVFAHAAPQSALRSHVGTTGAQSGAAESGPLSGAAASGTRGPGAASGPDAGAAVPPSAALAVASAGKSPSKSLLHPPPDAVAPSPRARIVTVRIDDRGMAPRG